MPSNTRNFFGRVVDRILPGTNYDTTTGQYSHIGSGLAGLGSKIAGSMLAGPAVGALVGKAAGYLIDKNGQPKIVSESVAPESNLSVSLPGYSVTQPVVANLGIGVQNPGNAWAGYMQSPGSLNNFGNTQFGTGQPQLGTWQPSSTWGQTIAAGNGSNLGFGNNVSAVTGGGGGSSAGVNSGSRGAGGGMPGIVGGNAAGQTVLDIWRGRYQQN